MSKAFEKLIKQAIEINCELIQLDNETEGFVIYLISDGIGYPADLSGQEILEVNKFVHKVKKSKGKFNYSVDNVEYKLSIQFRDDFGEQTFSLRII
jgi:hypothetical protein